MDVDRGSIAVAYPRIGRVRGWTRLVAVALEIRRDLVNTYEFASWRARLQPIRSPSLARPTQRTCG